MIYEPLDSSSKPSTVTNHLSGSEQQTHFSWMSKGDKDKFPYITLDHDCLNGRGPETITLHKLNDGVYGYYVKCYSCMPTMDGKPNTEFAGSQSNVMITQGGKQLHLPLVNKSSVVQNYHISSAAAGNPTRLWNVFKIVIKNKKAKIVPILHHVKHEPSFRNGKEEIAELLAVKPRPTDLVSHSPKQLEAGHHKDVMDDIEQDEAQHILQDMEHMKATEGTKVAPVRRAGSKQQAMPDSEMEGSMILSSGGSSEMEDFSDPAETMGELMEDGAVEDAINKESTWD